MNDINMCDIEADSLHEMLLSVYLKLVAATCPYRRLYDSRKDKENSLMVARQDAYAALSRFEEFQLDAQNKTGYKPKREYKTISDSRVHKE